MVELEDLIPYRFYELIPQWPKQCTCGNLLNLHMVNGSLNKICSSNWCQKQYEVPRKCTFCGIEYTFDQITCDTCEPEVIRIADLHMRVMNADKAIKKINRAYKSGKLNEEDWKSSILMYREDKERCERQL